MYTTIRSYSGSPGLVDALVDHENDVRQVINETVSVLITSSVRPVATR
jgi:hypothetical protein